MTDLLGVIRNVIKCFPNGKFTAHAVHPVSFRVSQYRAMIREEITSVASQTASHSVFFNATELES